MPPASRSYLDGNNVQSSANSGIGVHVMPIASRGCSGGGLLRLSGRFRHGTRAAMRPARRSTISEPKRPRGDRRRRGHAFSVVVRARGRADASSSNGTGVRPNNIESAQHRQAFEAVGANALYAPGLTRPEDIRTVCAAVSKPVNVVMGLKTASLSVADLAALGVRRISLGSALSRAALGAFLRAAREIRQQGTIRFAEDNPPLCRGERSRGQGLAEVLYFSFFSNFSDAEFMQ